MKKFIVIILCFSAMLSKAQTILLEEDVAGDTIPEVYGPNLKHYTHTYIGYGFAFGSSDLNYLGGMSYEFISGLRYKYKLSEAYSLGFNFSYNAQSYRIDPQTGYDRERLSLNNLELEVYNRLNVGKRGNVIGKYIDIGGYINYAIGTKYYLRKENTSYPSGSAKYEETTYRKLTYINSLNYGFTTRIGWDWFAIYGKYRLSDVSISGFPELPRFIAGVELSLNN